MSHDNTFDETVGSLETPGDGLDAATDEGHFETVVVAHEHLRALVAAEHANVSRMPADEYCHGHRVDMVTPFTAYTAYTSNWIM